MSLAGRLAQHGASRSSRSSADRRPARRRPAAPAERPGSGFIHEVVEVPCTGPRPPSLARDLAELTLPTAKQLAAALPTIASVPRAGLCPERPAVMFDLETTGLLGQSSAVIGVAGAAWHVAPDRLRVEQWSLARLGSEAAMLAHLRDTLCSVVGSAESGARRALVTFNGASFDLPLLKRRWVRLGVVRPTEDPLRVPHVDLLVPARRLWRDRGPNCRLGTLEQLHLRLVREGDVGGAEVVELLWRWLEEPEAGAEDLARVQRHNRIDVLSLAALARTMHERMRWPLDTVERLRAARHHQRLGRPELARQLLTPLLGALCRRAARSSWGSRSKTEAGRDRVAHSEPRLGMNGSSLEVEAGMLAAQLDKSEKRWASAAMHWARVCRAVRGHPDAHEGLAKHLEHRARQPAAALAIAAASQTPCPRRLARLRGKAAGVAIPPVGQVIDAWADPRGGGSG